MIETLFSRWLVRKSLAIGFLLPKSYDIIDVRRDNEHRILIPKPQFVRLSLCCIKGNGATSF